MIIRGVSVALAVAMTLAYFFALYVATYACYGESAGCAAGWTARTVVTAVYLPAVAVLIAVTRWRLRVDAKRRSDAL